MGTGRTSPAGSREASFDAVILGGGRAERLGGASKPEVVVEGRRLLDHALESTAGADRVVVVAPRTVRVPAGVGRTLEDPPFGGPVAGLAAGLSALRGDHPDLVLVLACDHPWAGPAVPRLLDAARQARDGAVLVDAAGRAQWLVAIYRRASLRARLGTTSGGSMRRLLAGLELARVPARAREAADIDTWQDLPGPPPSRAQ